MNKSYSRKIVSILDCCYSGAARIGKGGADGAAKLGRMAIDNGSKTLERGEGRCILAASQAYQKAFETLEQDHSLFTYYLLEGLNGKQAAAVDEDGFVTPDSLGRYVYNSIMSLPPERRSMQKPVRKVEESGDIALAYYPEFRRTEKMDPRARQNNSATSKDSTDKDSTERRLETSDFLRQVIQVEEYIRGKKLEKKEFALRECAMDLGISINGVRLIISYFQKNKFQCKICGQRFKSAAELNIHLKTHES
jgi:Zinc finger, C2H2 type